MTRWAVIVLCWLLPLAALAGGDKRVSHRYNDVSIAEALKQLGKECKGRYVINFMYDELEDFRVTARIKKQTVPDAIRQMIGHYPISVTIEGDSAIYVECVQRHPARLKGIVVDENGQPLEYANVSLLSPVDSSMVGGGVTTASGRFVIPYEPQPAIVRVASNAELPQAEQAEAYKKCIEYCDRVINFKQDQYKVDEKGNLNRMMDTYVLSNYGYPLIAEKSSTSTSGAPAAYNAIFGEGNSYESLFELTFGHADSDVKNTAVGEMYGYSTSGDSYRQLVACNSNIMTTAIESSKKNYNDQELFPVTTDYRSLYCFRFTDSGSYPILKYSISRFQDDQDFGTASTTWKVPSEKPQNMSGLRGERTAYSGWIIYRLTDVMLMRAEAEIELAGMMSPSVEWMDKEITTAYRDGATLSTAEDYYMDAFNIICAVYLRSNPSAQTQQTQSCPKLDSYTDYNSFVTLCENERRRELMFEGKRYYDLVRRARREGNTSHFAAQVASKFGEASKAVLIKMALMDFMYMPYAEAQLDVNPNLHQNPAYAEDEDIVKQ